MMEQKPEILIVDDNVEWTSNLQDILQVEGYIVAIAHDGRAALSLSKEKTFDLAIVDFKLPDRTGLELIGELSRVCIQTVYIIVTGYASLHSALEAVKQKSIIAYETKPLDMKRFLNLINQVIKRGEVQKELHESEERFRNLVFNLTDLVMEIDSQGKFTYVSPQIFNIFGYTPEEALGLNAFEFVHPDDIPKCMEAMASTRQVVNLEYRSRHKDGHYVHASTSGKIVPDVHGGNSLISVLRDITEQKNVEAEKKELERRAYISSRLTSIGEMAAGIAHEINNPLTSVIGFADLLLERKDVPDDIRQSLEVIHSGSVRVAGIVRQLLAFARQDRVKKEYVNVNEIIENTLAMMAYTMKSENMEVRTHLASGLPGTMGVAGQLQQVFLNIIMNAETEMKRAHGKGKLLVETEAIDNVIRISFEDDGPGIAPETLDRIFEPFFTTRDVGEGTGLGLSICHGIITEHRGRLYVRSELGKGATFIVELPVIAVQEQVELAEAVVDEAEKVTGAKILVVDDEPGVQKFLKQVLTAGGHNVETVDNAEEAMERIKGGRYDLILTDIKMPGMSGIELYKNVQKVARSLSRRVMFMTGDVISTDTRDFLSRTKAPHIPKPFDIEKLVKDINGMLTGNRG